MTSEKKPPTPDADLDPSGRDVVATGRRRRSALVRYSVAPLILTALATCWVVEESRPNLTLLAFAGWVLWLAALVRASTVHLVGDDWVGVRGLIFERRIHLSDVQEIIFERLDPDRESITFVSQGWKSVRFGDEVLLNDVELLRAVRDLTERHGDKVRLESGRFAHWI